MGTKLLFSSAFHLQTNGQSKRVIKILEDLLRACVIEFQGMVPYEVLHGRKCRSPIHWDEISPMNGVMRFGKKGNFSPRFIGPFEILERVGALTYKVAILHNLAEVHSFFHISMIHNHMSNSSPVLNYEPLLLTPNLTYEEKPTQKLGRKENRLRQKMIKMVKVKRLNPSEKEVTSEAETDMRIRYPDLFGKY
ncbi:uncharacterized protein [Primulina eburnea]|uniref:uncharacterized protein n=1 Tax=Primulina eburnea TaxID=1245227 RepID=UPI003C6C119A